MKTIRFFCVTAAVLILVSCTQEHLIFLMNLQRADLLTVEQIVRESGLEKPAPEPESPAEKPRSSRPAPVDPAPSVPVTNIRRSMTVAPDQDFSVTLKDGSNTVIVKSVEGGVSFQGDKSEIPLGMFVFRSGTNDGRIHLQTVFPDGPVRQNVYYTVHVRVSAAPAPAATNAVRKSAPAAAQAQTNGDAVPTPNLSQMIVSATGGLSPTEAVRELQKMLNSSSLTDVDRELIRYKMVEILIEQRAFTRAETEINLIRNERRKDLYRARLQSARNNGKEAVRSYLSALGGDDETRKMAILELETVLIRLGAVDRGLIGTLIAETKKYRSDVLFYAESMIAIARIFQYVPDVYAARDILKPLLQAEWPEEVRAKAQAAYDELERQFLDYR